jgi:CHAT domain-containing protein
VADCSTADLTVAFFSGLTRSPGAEAGAALREAKLALLGRPATAHPYHWAPFVLVGASGEVSAP